VGSEIVDTPVTLTVLAIHSLTGLSGKPMIPESELNTNTLDVSFRVENQSKQATTIRNRRSDSNCPICP
jgi:hypothetical protein